jgi:hypothetical protein
LGKLDTLGDRLAGGLKAYNEVVASFEGNVVPKTRQLEQMGVKKGTPHKALTAIEVPRREFKDRVVKELSRAPKIPLVELPFVPEHGADIVPGEPSEQEPLSAL